jgi:thymidylate synthase (FAD)
MKKTLNECISTAHTLPQVELLESSSLYVIARAIRKSRDSMDKLDTPVGSNALGSNDRKLIKLIMQEKHESTLEHSFYCFDISNISRACLFELTRHRIASYTVQSTRYTLKKHKNKDLVELYLSTGQPELDLAIETTLKKLFKRMNNGVIYTNDELKYLIPEALLSNLVMSINIRSFRNFLKLRLHKSALKEIRLLAHQMLMAVPQEHRDYIYKDIVEEYY